MCTDCLSMCQRTCVCVVWWGVLLWCLSHTRWFHDVLVTLFASLVEDRRNEKLLKYKSMRPQTEGYVSQTCLYVNVYVCVYAAGACESLHMRAGLAYVYCRKID